MFPSNYLLLPKEKENPNIDLSQPYLTYNAPQGEYPYNSKRPQPILLDFYITNCELSKDGYKVRLTIDNDVKRNLISWQPYYIYGLAPGTHKIRLELLDPQNSKVSGQFNDVQRTFTIR